MEGLGDRRSRICNVDQVVSGFIVVVCLEYQEISSVLSKAGLLCMHGLSRAVLSNRNVM